MALTGPQFEQLQTALLHAYDETSLTQMVRIQLGEDVRTVAGGANFNDLVFNLITWAERTGRTNQLIAGASASNPNNPELKLFTAQYAEAAGGQAATNYDASLQAAREAQGDAAKLAWRRDGRSQLLMLLSLLVPMGMVVWWVLYVAGLNAERLSEPGVFYLLVGELTVMVSGYILLWSFWLYPRWLSR